MSILSQDIDKSICRFIWGSSQNHWVDWNSVTQSRNKVKLGVRQARNLNVALLGKHSWSLIYEPHKLWVQIVGEKYFLGTDLMHASLRKGISYSWKSLFQALETLKPVFQYRVGKGEISLFYVCDTPYPNMHINEKNIQNAKSN